MSNSRIQKLNTDSQQKIVALAFDELYRRGYRLLQLVLTPDDNPLEPQGVAILTHIKSRKTKLYASVLWLRGSAWIFSRPERFDPDSVRGA